MTSKTWREPWLEPLGRLLRGDAAPVRCTAGPKYVVLRLEEFESRLSPAGLSLSASVTAQPAITFNASSGTLAILARSGGATVDFAETADGAVSLIVNGQTVAGGASAAAIRQIQLSGGGAADQLTLDGIASASDLTVSSDGDLTIDGTVEAGALTLASTGLLDVESGAVLLARSGGSITASANSFVNVGQVRADGAAGGDVSITAADYLNAGTVSASGLSGAGGAVNVDFTDSYIDTAAALTAANGTGWVGGQVSINGGVGGRLFSSGGFAATGTAGGNIDLFGQNIFLVGGTVDASGAVGAGGRIRVGGDYQGSNPAVPNAQTADVTGTTVLRADGVGGGGRVIVWSEGNTDFSGTISAVNGGSGEPGFIEVSSHGQLTYGGTADAGKGGSLLLDPQNLVIDETTGVFPQFQLLDPGSGGDFGAAVVPLQTGNIVVTDPDVNNNTGAVYLFDGTTGALIGALVGTMSGDQIGSAGVTALTNGNYVVDSPDCFGDNFGGLTGIISDGGAVTWGNGLTGISGAVSVANSLEGTPEGPYGDLVGSFGVTALTNGNYVVASPFASNGYGIVTWGNGLTGIVGLVEFVPGIEGGQGGDEVGYGGVTALANGNYVVASPFWSVPGSPDDAEGAATWGNGSTGVIAGFFNVLTVSAANSLVGSSPNEYVGGFGFPVSPHPDIVALANGNYVVATTGWNGDEGAVTWGSGTAGVIGAISAANSLVGSSSGDDVGGGGFLALTNGNYVVASPYWNGGEGAATWGNGTAGVTGIISAANSLVGSSSGDYVGRYRYQDSINKTGSLFALANGNYVVASPQWNGNRGAVTWGSGTAGVTGDISAANSLVGSSSGDFVGGAFYYSPADGGYYAGNGDIAALTDGNYVVGSPDWGGSLGAATWGNGLTGVTGIISAANSLVGSNPHDAVGGANTFVSELATGGVFALTNGNYVVASPNWNGEGAATWGNGTTGITGVISTSNSLVGSSVGEGVGGYVTALSDGNYVVASLDGISALWAWTWGNGQTGVIGPVSASNSLMGGGVTSEGIVALPSGDYVVVSTVTVENILTTYLVTWGDGTTGSTLDGENVIDTENSINLGQVKGYVPFIQPFINNTFIVGQQLSGSGTLTDTQVFIGFTDPNQLDYALADGQTITVTPDFLTRTLDAGTNVTLQADDDITVNSPIIENPTGAAGNLTLEAGRSILLNASINTDGGNLTLIANDTKADGVVDSERDPGNAAITMVSGVTLNTGAGALSVDLKHSTDKTNNGSGVVTLLGASAGAAALSSASTLGVTINGTTAGDGVAAGTYTQTNITGPINLNGASLQITHTAATAVGSTFTIVQTTGGVTGTFNGLNEGAVVIASDGTVFTISYQGDGGNAVVLTQVPVTLNPSALPQATVGSAYSQTITAIYGTAPYTFQIISGGLPAGLSLSAGLLSGTPTAGGSFSLTVQATDSSASPQTGSRSYSLTVAAPTITLSAALAAAQVGAVYNQTITASGGTASYSFKVTSGALPAGLSLSTGGVLSSTPTAGGTATFTVTATDSSTGTGPYSASRSYSLTVSAAASATAAVAASTTFNSAGQTVALSATVTSGAGTVNEGTETFTILSGTTVVGTAITVNVVSGTASVNYTLPAGTAGGAYIIQAVYNGDANYATSTDASHALTIGAAASATTAANTSTTFNANAQVVGLSATVTSGVGAVSEGTETFTILKGSSAVGAAVTVNVVSGVASANYTLPAGVSGGSYTLQAVYNGDASYLTSTDASHTLTIGAASSTTAAAAASTAFNSSSRTVALSATVASGAGTVNEGTETFTILNGTTVIGTPVTVNVVSGVANAAYTLPAGTLGGSYTIQAVYNGDANFLGYTDKTHHLIVNAAASATVAAAASTTFNTSTQTVALSAAITSGAGTVNEGSETFSILNGTTVIGTAVTVNVVSGAANANYALPAGLSGGSYIIQAVYNGDANFLGYTDKTHHLIVNAAASATAASTASATFNSAAQTVALSATVTSAAGTVNEGTETFTILKGATVIGAPVTVNVVSGVASANYTLPAGVSGGSYTIQAVYNGDSNFLAFTDNTHHLTVSAAASATAAAAVSAFYNFAAQTVALSATATSAAGTVNEGTETFTILNGTAVIGTAVTVNVVSGAAHASYILPAGVSLGSYTIQAVYNGDANFLAVTDASHALTVSASVTTAVLKSDGSLWQYTPTGAMQWLSPAGTIRAVSTVLDVHGQTDIFAITTGAFGAQYNNTLWKFDPSSGWSEQSSGSFQQVSAATDSSGRAIEFALTTAGALYEQSYTKVLNAGFTLLSPAGTIKSISAVTDTAGNDNVYAIVTADNSLWLHRPQSWLHISTGSFQQISAGLNSVGQVIVYGVLTNGQLWEQNPAFGPVGLNTGFKQLSGMNGLPPSFLSVQTGGPDHMFAIATDKTVWEHTPTTNTHVSVALEASQLSATETPSGADEVFMTLIDGSFWEYSLTLPGGFKELLPGGVTSSSTPA